MAQDKSDWRLTGQESYLQGASFTWKPYRAWSETWDHDHCEFCWAKFMDPGSSEKHRVFVEANPEVFTEGYATTAEDQRGDGYHWVCKRCYGDFAELFEFRVV